MLVWKDDERKVFFASCEKHFFSCEKSEYFFMEGLIFLNGYDIMYRTKGAECEKALPWEERS